MISWTPKPSAPAPQRWQSRAEILKNYLDSLSPAELLCVRPDYYALRFGPGAVSRSDTRKFNPNQPRVPAGNPDGGQWTSGGNGSEEFVTSEGDGRAVYIAVGAASGDGDADNPEFLRVASTVAIDYSRALTGISTIDQTTKALSETLARVMNAMDFIPKQTPQAYGTAVHLAFGTLVRFQGLPGIGPNDVEHSFVGGESGRRYGEPDSVRTDVVLRNDAGDVIAIYDVKTGERGLTPARVRELREKTGAGPNIPIIELHVRRGASLKGHVRRQRSIGFIMAQLWDPTHHRDNAGLGASP